MNNRHIGKGRLNHIVKCAECTTRIKALLAGQTVKDIMKCAQARDDIGKTATVQPEPLNPPPKSAVLGTCKNCGLMLDGGDCENCGQKNGKPIYDGQSI